MDTNNKKTKRQIKLPYHIENKVYKQYYKSVFSNEVLDELKEYYCSSYPYMDMGYIARYCQSNSNRLYGNSLFQYVQNYLEFLYGYKDFTDEFDEILISIKNMFDDRYLPTIKYMEKLDDYHYPGGHSGGSMSVCLNSLYRLIKTHHFVEEFIGEEKVTRCRMNMKYKRALWKQYCRLAFRVN